MFDTYWIAKETLLVGRLKGILDASTAEKVIEFIETKEIISQVGFSRFVDLSQLEGIHLSSYDVIRLAARRREFNPNDFFVKSAFFATDPLAFGIGRMYEQLLRSPRIEVRVWDDMREAATWLGVKLDSLTI